jgi:hypothetical protein
MKCVNFKCNHNKNDECNNPRIIHSNVKCGEIQVETDCFSCNLNEANKCPDCCKDWNEELDD